MIELRNTTLGYGRTTVATDLTLTIPTGSVTMIVGPNGCGKSTALRALSRLITPTAGTVVLDGADIHGLATRDLARKLGILSQHPTAPAGIRVAELVARGRYPHQGVASRWSAQDEAAVAEAMRLTGVAELSAEPVDRLSGGQRQRVWIAMALAQRTPLLLLDEPTTFLDLAHQLDVLELFGALAAEGRTVAAVVHDLTQACRFATHLIAMRDGTVIAAGSPRDIVTPELLRAVFDVEATVTVDLDSGIPHVLPLRTVRSTARGPLQ